MLLIKNANIYAPQPIGHKDLLVGGGRILAMEDHIEPHSAFETWDAEGKIVTPGIVDQHIHVIGAAYSYNVGMSSRRGRGSGDILYLDADQNPSLPNFSKPGVDFLFKYQGFSAVGEFVSTAATVPDDIVYRVRNDGSLATTFPVGDGDDVENYVKGRMMLGMGYNIQMGYLFKNRFSFDARYTHLSADEYSFLNNGIFYNRPNYYTSGVSQYLSKMYGIKIRASVDCVDAAEGSNDFDGVAKTGDEWIFRLITSFAL